WIIDTPGIRSFGLEHVDINRIVASFSELSEVISQCPKNCSHDEAACALNDFLANQPQSKERISSLRRLLSFKSQPIT
ncbi:MAG: ribosome small subunit-dependent GTPase A, partial [Actinobacteria bacterium]|nr:ribosome small subunit-dependent GTPase A [Actinomycetota bacterium]